VIADQPATEERSPRLVSTPTPILDASPVGHEIPRDPARSTTITTNGGSVNNTIIERILNETEMFQPMLHAIAPIYRVKIKGTPVLALLDTGACQNFLNRDLATRLRLSSKKLPHTYTVMVADGAQLDVNSEVTSNITIGNFTTTAKFHLLDTKYAMLLGMPFLEAHAPEINWRDGNMRIRDRGDVYHIATALCPTKQVSAAPTNSLNELKPVLREIHVDDELRETDIAEFLMAIVDDEVDHDFVTPPAATQQQTPETSTGERPTSVREWPPSGLPREIGNVLREYQDVFPEHLPAKLPPSRAIDHRIDVDETQPPPVAKPYRMSPLEERELQRQLREYLEMGQIEPCSSPYSSAVLFAKKKDGSLRLCVDYRALNKITRKDKYPLPRIDEQLDAMRDSSFFTKLDLISGYHQLRVYKDHVYRTAFTTKFGTYQFKVLPFGLTNAPATFQRLMNELMTDYLRENFVKVYLDDIVIHSRDLNAHADHLRRVLQTFRDQHLYCKANKCLFAKDVIPFCGYLVSASGIRPMPDKLDVLKTWPVPHDVTTLRRFLGFSGFYRRFVKDYAKIVTPL